MWLRGPIEVNGVVTDVVNDGTLPVAIDLWRYARLGSPVQGLNADEEKHWNLGFKLGEGPHRLHQLFDGRADTKVCLFVLKRYGSMGDLDGLDLIKVCKGIVFSPMLKHRCVCILH